MSLPQAQQEISTNPAAGTVTDPVNKSEKDADVARKIKLYGVIEAFRQGRMPDNAQIDKTLQYVLDTAPFDTSKLSPEGQKLVQDTREIISTARSIVQQKNSDELFQQFVWHTRGVDVTAAKKDTNEVLPVDQEKAREDGQQAVQHLRTILSLVLTNAEVRKLLADFSLIGRDLLARGASKAATNLRPTDEQLRRVDESGPRDQFITEGGRVAGANETPVPEARIPGTNTTVAQHPDQPLGYGAKVTTGEGDVRSGASVKQEAEQRKDELQSRGLAEADRHTQDVRSQAGQEGLARDGPEGDAALRTRSEVDSRIGGAANRTDATDTDRKVDQTADMIGQEARGIKDDFDRNAHGAQADAEHPDPEVRKRGLMDRAKGFRDDLAGRVPQEHRDRARDQYNRGKEFLTDEYFPEERRDQFIFRGKKVIMECQNHDDYQESIRWLLNYLEEYVKHGRTIANHGQDSKNKLAADGSVQQALSEVRTLLERFANGQSMKPIFHSIDVLIDDANKDPELRQWFQDVNTYIRKVLLSTGYVLEPDCNNQAKALRESGRRFYDDKYKGHFDNLFDTSSAWFRALGDDPLNARFGDDWARLVKDLLFDSEGSLKFKPDLWGDIRKVILPAVIDKVGYIPIPRIEYTDDSMDLVVENLTLSGRNLFPNIVSLEAHNFFKFSPYAAINDQSNHDFTFTFSQMQADMRDVAFYFRRKSGIKLKDSGLADIVLGGEGITATVHLTSAQKDKSSVFKVKNVNVKVDSLKFSIRDSKHDLLYKTLKPLATGLVKKQIQKAIEDALRTGLEYVDGQLVGVRDRMEEAKHDENQNRAQAIKDYFQTRKDEASSKASDIQKHHQFKVVSNKRDSILAQEGHPAGWVNRTAEKQEAAGKGSEWHSDAFNIVM